MYSITATYVKEDYAWTDADVSSLTLQELLAYQNVRVSLTWESDIEQDFFFSENRSTIINGDQSLTLTEWVATLAQDALTVTDKAAGLISTNCVVTWDLFDYAGAIETSNMNYGEGVAIPEGFDTDLRFQGDGITSSQYSTENIAANCVASVNGLIYPLELYNGWVYIRNAVAQMRLEEDASVMMIDFTALGGIETIALTEANTTKIVKSMDVDKQILTNIRIDLGLSATQYVPLVVADGYLNILNGSYKLVEADKLVFTVDHFKALKRAARKPKYTRNWVDPANLQGNGLLINSFDATKFMTDTSSFVILVKNKDLAVKREAISSANLPRTYYHYRIPKGLIFFNDGLLANAKVMDYNEFSAAIVTLNNSDATHTWEVNRVNEGEAYTDNGYLRSAPRYKEAYVKELYSFA